jgi:hypothetical protein
LPNDFCTYIQIQWAAKVLPPPLVFSINSLPFL